VRYKFDEDFLENLMKKTFAIALLALIVANISGCFPIFVPMPDPPHHRR
jgi:hypothetical protein